MAAELEAGAELVGIEVPALGPAAEATEAGNVSDGLVRIYSEIDIGTTVSIFLPRYTGEAGTSSDNAPKINVEHDGNGGAVLLVDEEPTIRMLAGEVLVEAGFSFIEAKDAESAMRILRSDTRIDLRVTDVGLPGGMNGRQLADAANALHPAVKVLFITGYAENAALGNGALGQHMRVMTKPFDMDHLASRVAEIIDGKR